MQGLPRLAVRLRRFLLNGISMTVDQHLPERFGKFKGAETLPLMAVAWISNACNSSCRHCPFNLRKELRKMEKNTFMPWGIFKKIVDDLCVENGRLIRLTGSGEPFLHSDLIRFVTYAKERGVKTGLITNGSLFDDYNIDALLKARADIIEISIDAADKDVYSQIRRGLDFDAVHDNIVKLVRRRDQLNSGSSVIVSVIDQPDILKDPEAAVRYWEKIADKVLLRKWITWNVLDTSNFTRPFLDPARRVPCPWPFDRMHITSDGDVVFCADDLKREHVIGNVMEKTLSELWNCEKFERYRGYHLALRFDKIGICAGCRDWPYKSWKHNYFRTVDHAAKNF